MKNEDFTSVNHLNEKCNINITQLVTKNREKLYAELPDHSIVALLANDEMPRNGDQFFPYRQSSDFYYLTGLNEPKSALLIRKGNGMKDIETFLFLREADQKFETWNGSIPGLNEAAELTGIEEVYPIEEFQSLFTSFAKEISTVFFDEEMHMDTLVCLISNRENTFARLKYKHPNHHFNNLHPLICRLRMVKEMEEMSLIRKAISITNSTFRELLPNVKPGMSENEIEAYLTYAFTLKGASGHAFAPIVAAGINACTLHYTKNNGRCSEDELLLMDFGAEYSNYASDCSRTLPVNGKFSPRQRQLYKATLGVFMQAKQLLKPGISINEVQKEVIRLWEREHVNLGLYSLAEMKKQDPENPLFFNYFMHGVSHFMGLDVHDPGSRDLKLQPGMVLTCEPGIYIREEATGIRLENNLLITDDGNTDLMEEMPLEIEEIEQIMNQRV